METIIKINRKEGTVKLEGDSFPLSDSFILTVVRLLLQTRKEKKDESKIDAEFSLQSEIKKLEDSERRDLNIIALYFTERKPELLNKEQYGVALKRHLRDAGALVAFTDKQIIAGMEKARKHNPGWTLGSIIKELTK